MLICFHGGTLPQAAQLIPILLKCIEKAAAQPTQAPTVTEGLCAACLLLKLSTIQDTGFGNMWSIVLDMEKQIFVSEKFLIVANENALVHVMILCETLLQYPEKLNGKASPIHRAILYCLTSGSSSVRRRCFPMVKKLVNGSGGTVIAKSLLKEMLRFYEGAKIATNSERESSPTDAIDSSISSHTLIECVTTFCSSQTIAPEDARPLAYEALLPAHHPAIVQHDPKLWLKTLKHLKLRPREFIGQNANQLRGLLLNEGTVTDCSLNALSTIVAINPDVLLPNLVDNVTSKLSDANLLRVTKDDYFTYLTPEGELYDKSVIPGSDEAIINNVNMKRESKVYSFKDQVSLILSC